MAITTAIHYADSTVNGMAGCDGCELWQTRPDGSRVKICYAGVMTENKLGQGPLKGWPVSFDVPTLFPGRIEKAARWKDLQGTKRPGRPWLDGLPRIIFCDDMGDRWTASLPIDSLAPTLPAIAASPHIYLFLTKRPDRAATFSRQYRLPDNLWLGTTITSSQDARVRALERARAARLWVSYEPILADAGDIVRRHPDIHWWVFGGPSGSQAVPIHLGIIRRGIEACRDTGAAPFVKQLGRAYYDDDAEGSRRRIFLQDRKGGAMDEWPREIRVREYPKGVA
jgi:protein gp37